MFQSDFKIVADYFYQKEHKKNYKPSAERIKHVDEVMKLLKVLSNDEQLELPKLTAKERKEGVTMASLWGQAFKDGEARGEKRGEKKGKMELLYFQVRDGVISKKQAAQYAGVTPQTFSRKMKAAGY